MAPRLDRRSLSKRQKLDAIGLLVATANVVDALPRRGRTGCILVHAQESGLAIKVAGMRTDTERTLRVDSTAADKTSHAVGFAMEIQVKEPIVY